MAGKRRSMRWHPEQCRLVITKDGEERGYVLLPERLAPGVAEVEYRKLANGPGEECESYKVRCGVGGKGCTCKGFASHKRCKHSASLAALCERGLIS